MEPPAATMRIVLMSKHRVAKHNAAKHVDATALSDTIACLSILSMCYTVFTLFIYREHVMGVLTTVCTAIVLMFGYGWTKLWLENRRDVRKI